MYRFLPSPFARFSRHAIFVACGWVWLAAAFGQEDEGGEEEDTVVLIKQLVFIEEIVDDNDPGGVAGLRYPFEVEVASDGGHVYVAAQSDHSVTAFTRTESTGELSYIGQTLLPDEASGDLQGARSLALSPDGEWLYVVSMLSDTLVGFSRSLTTGQLSHAQTITDNVGGVDGLQGARSVVASPDGRNLYVAAHDESKVSAFSVNTSTGRASFLAVYEEGDAGVEELSKPHALAMSPDGKHLYAALMGREIITFTRDTATGLLNFESSVSYLESSSSGETLRAVAMSPDGKFLYVASWNDDAVSVFSRDAATGELTHAFDTFNSDSGVEDMDGPHAVSISADGRFLYVAAFADDAVVTFERDATTGRLEYYQSIKPEEGDDWELNGPISLGTSPDGEYVYVGAGARTNRLVTFRREVIEEPPELVVHPVDLETEEGQSAAFYALAQGVDLKYQWLRDGVALSGETLPVLALESVAAADDGAEFAIEVSNPGGILTSTAVTLTVLPPLVLNPPADLTALDISSASARLSWKDNSDNETGFEIQRRELGGEFAALTSVAVDETHFEDASLEASTTYIYRVRARRVESESLWSNDAVIESFADVPQAPVSLRVAVQEYNRIGLQWSDRSAVEEGFRIERRKDEFGAEWETLATAEKDRTTYLDRAVDPLSAYAYRIQAFNESGFSGYSNSVVGITGSIPVDEISPISRAIPREALGGWTVSVTSDQDWEALSEVDWLVVTAPTGGAGSGNGSVSYRSRLNESQSERSGKIVIGGIEHTVVQEGSPPFLRIEPGRSLVASGGGSFLVDVESNVDWNAAESVAWLSISSGASGSGYGTVVLAAEANDSLEPRFAEININDSIQIVEQSGVSEFVAATATPERFFWSGGTGTISVTSNMAWELSTDSEWIRFDTATTGDGDGAVTFEVSENRSGATRSAELRINDVALSVTQDAELESDIAAPEWSGITVGPLGAELNWIDSSTDERGFRIYRRVAGSDRRVLVVETSADTTQFFDFDAPRGKRVHYELRAVDAVGLSAPAEMLSDELPDGNWIAAGVLAASEPTDGLALLDLRFAGAGEIDIHTAAFGDAWLETPVAALTESRRVLVDTDGPQFSVTGEAVAFDWRSYFELAAVLSAESLVAADSGTQRAARRVGSEEAYPRGVRAWGRLGAESTGLVAAFEIGPGMALPIVLQGVGSSLPLDSGQVAALDLTISLYRINGDGSATLLRSNSDWRSAENDTGLDAVLALRRRAAFSELDTDGEECRILMNLPEGRYVCILRSEQTSPGNALLEVLDLR